MTVDNLQQLAVTRPPEAVIKLESFLVAGADASIVFSAVPWWNNSNKVCRVQVELRGVVETQFLYRSENLPTNFPSEVTEETTVFEATNSDPLLLNYGPTATIFGNAPLPDPPKFLFDFYRLVTGKLRIARDPVSYLNAKDGISQSGFAQSGISRWLEFVYSRSYCLLSAPEVVVEGAKELLDAQLAEYMILPDQKPTAISQELQVLKFAGSFAIFRNSGVKFL